MPKFEWEKANRRDRDKAAEPKDHYAWPKKRAKPHPKTSKTTRTVGTNQRARGINPRALKRNPRSLNEGHTDTNGITWPIHVTVGPLTTNGLTTLTFTSRQDADDRGFPWVGRLR